MGYHLQPQSGPFSTTFAPRELGGASTKTVESEVISLTFPIGLGYRLNLSTIQEVQALSFGNGSSGKPVLLIESKSNWIHHSGMLSSLDFLRKAARTGMNSCCLCLSQQCRHPVVSVLPARGKGQEYVLMYDLCPNSSMNSLPDLTVVHWRIIFSKCKSCHLQAGTI